MYRRAENYQDITLYVHTALTRAIYSGNYDDAIKMMKSYYLGAIVDMGPNGGKPLQLVLLTKNYGSPHNIVHLQLAKMLVMAGASPNLGTVSQIQTVSKETPTELLLSIIDLMEQVLHFKGRDAMIEEYFQCYGLQGETLVYAQQVLEHAVKLLHMFLDFGADPNLVTMKYFSTIFHIYLLQSHAKVKTILKFHAAGADLTKYNLNNSTPLMALIMSIPNESVITVLKQMWPPHYEMANMNLKNARGWTALCYAMYVGSVDVAILLVQRDADLHACKVDVYHHSHIVRKISITPLLFPLLCSSKPYLNIMYGKEKTKEVNIKFFKKVFSHEIFEKIMSLIIAPVFDSVVRNNGCVNEVGSNLLTLMPDRWKIGTDVSVSDVACLVVGKMSTNLQQLCVRRIVVEFINARKSGDAASYVDPSLAASNIATFKNSVPEIVANLDPHAVTKIVTEDLSLPSFMVCKFFLEFARLEMGTVLYKYRTRPDNVFNEDSEEETTSSRNDIDNASSSRSSQSSRSRSMASYDSSNSWSYVSDDMSSSDSSDSSLQNVENSGTGASLLENVDVFQSDALLENVDISQYGTLTVNNVECSQIGESSERVDVYQVVPFSSEYVENSVSSAVSSENVDISQGGAVSSENVEISHLSSDNLENSEGDTLASKDTGNSEGGTLRVENIQNLQDDAVLAGEGDQRSQLDSRYMDTVDTVLPHTSDTVQEHSNDSGSGEVSPAESTSQYESSPNVCRKNYATLEECSVEDEETENIP